jgi:heme o synthase
MNPSTTELFSHEPAASAIQSARQRRVESPGVAHRISDCLTLTKARANVAVVATAFVGFALHAGVSSNWRLLLHTLAGTGLLATSAAVANQAMEREFDRNMARTRNRPIAAGRLRRRTAVWLSAALGGAGSLWLGAGVNLRALLFAGLALLIYVLLYTPLKRRTPACTLVGAVSGALPLLVGWAATGADFGFWAAVAFAVLFLWQMPHFLAIAWRHRVDYLGAGYRVLCHGDHQGQRTAGWALGFTVAVVAVSLTPVLAGRVTDWYWPGALAAGILFSNASIRFLVSRTEVTARALFLASLYYLPAVYLLMLLCKIRS